MSPLTPAAVSVSHDLLALKLRQQPQREQASFPQKPPLRTPRIYLFHPPATKI